MTRMRTRDGPGSRRLKRRRLHRARLSSAWDRGATPARTCPSSRCAPERVVEVRYDRMDRVRCRHRAVRPMAPDPIAFSCLLAPRDQPVSFDLKRPPSQDYEEVRQARGVQAEGLNPPGWVGGCNTIRAGGWVAEAGRHGGSGPLRLDAMPGCGRASRRAAVDGCDRLGRCPLRASR